MPRSAQGNPTETKLILDELDLIFTILFTIELALNMYAHLFWDFISGIRCSRPLPPHTSDFNSHGTPHVAYLPVVAAQVSAFLEPFCSLFLALHLEYTWCRSSLRATAPA